MGAVQSDQTPSLVGGYNTLDPFEHLVSKLILDAVFLLCSCVAD